MHRSAAALLLLASCHNHLPSALSLPEEATEVVAPELHFATHDEALRYVIARDPLVRKPRLPPDEALAEVPGAAALAETAAEIRRYEGPGRDLTGGLKVIAERRPGTETRAIARGYRLGLADRIVGSAATDPGDVQLHDLAPLLSDLLRDEQAALRSTNALDFLTGEGLAFPDAVRRYGDRWVLSAWLDGPDVPLGPVTEALRASAYDVLRESRLGRLLVARAEGRTGEVAPGLADLHRATELELQKVSADRHQEQGAWADVRRAVVEELGTEDPVGFLLDRAADRLTAAAGDPEATAGALVALTARRIVGGCDWNPCHGLDRTGSLTQASRFDADLDPVVRAWRVIALKDALDTMDVGHDSVLFRRALADLVDALIGTGGTPMQAGVLTRVAPEPEVWSLLGGAVGEPTSGTWEQARAAIGRHLGGLARVAQEDADPSWRPWLDRIERRAVP